MNSHEGSRAANALGGKTARPCDNCLLRRARWFCAADDAFLCQACDVGVHSANQLAGRHHRVRLEVASCKGGSELPAWHQGFRRKARTRRRGKPVVEVTVSNPVPVVPEINGEEFLLEEKEEQLVHSVPEFNETLFVEELDLVELLDACNEFGQDVGDLLSDGNGMSEKGLAGRRVKVEDEDEEDDEVHAVIASHFDPKLDMELNWEFDDYACSVAEEDGDEVKRVVDTLMVDDESGSQVQKHPLLQLNYEEIIDAWGSQGSPWENGVRPCFDIDNFMAECVEGDSHPYKGATRQYQAEREARVLRYREKRRTRLFSKKIRYEVRKLNAEKRPRMKGRFVKRTNFSKPSLPYMMNK